uniref:Uncharacterized protein n=1 Tax=Pyricularia oryzae (strain P131) TaxID=1143193 RepID=L7J0V5_PYRO1
MHGFVFAGLDKSWASSSKTSTDSTKASARPNPGGGFVANENFKRIYCMGRGEGATVGMRLNQARMSGQVPHTTCPSGRAGGIGMIAKAISSIEKLDTTDHKACNQERSCGRGSMSEPNLIVSFAPGQA